MQAYLSFDGNCAEAFAFYAKALCGAITASHTFGQSPMAGNVPKEAQGRIMHIAMQADGMTLFGSDLMPGMPFEGFKGFSLSVQRQGVDVGAAVFKALSGHHAVCQDLLGRRLWHAGRPLWRALDGQLRALSNHLPLSLG